MQPGRRSSAGGRTAPARRPGRASPRIQAWPAASRPASSRPSRPSPGPASRRSPGPTAPPGASSRPRPAAPPRAPTRRCPAARSPRAATRPPAAVPPRWHGSTAFPDSAPMYSRGSPLGPASPAPPPCSTPHQSRQSLSRGSRLIVSGPELVEFSAEFGELDAEFVAEFGELVG